jgi:hypothetical protein
MTKFAAILFSLFNFHSRFALGISTQVFCSLSMFDAKENKKDKKRRRSSGSANGPTNPLCPHRACVPIDHEPVDRVSFSMLLAILFYFLFLVSCSHFLSFYTA